MLYETWTSRFREFDVRKKMKNESISNPTEETQKKIHISSTNEPRFSINHRTGKNHRVLPGNRRYQVGDKEAKRNPPNGDGNGGPGSETGLGEDDFIFDLSHEEFMNFIFDHLELPDMVKKQLKEVKTYTLYRAGYKTVGSPSQLDLIKSSRNALARRIGLGRPSLKTLQRLEQELDKETDPEKKIELRLEIDKALKKRRSIPWIDPIDVKYRNYTLQPRPRSKAVMFCVMDVSFSMTEELKSLAKSFFMLLNLFLKRKYDQVDVIFIRHHTDAQEVDEEYFFYGQETGGTVVSTAFELMDKIITERYPVSDWNIYCAQASDGDNFPMDNPNLENVLERVLKKCQYMAYIQTTTEDRSQDGFYGYMKQYNLWTVYSQIAATNPKLQMKEVTCEQDVWVVFSELFHKERKNVNTLV